MDQLPAVLGGILFVTLVFFGYLWWISRLSARSLRAVHEWARENGFELLTAAPWPNRSVLAWDVTVRRPDGTEARAWVVVGTYLLGFWRKARVRWKK